MNKLLVILVGAALLAVTSCIKEIEYKGDAGESKMVVNAIMEADSTIRIHVERSRFFLDAEFSEDSYWIKDATVILTTQNGQSYTQTTMDDEGFYVFPITAQAGASYVVSVAHSDYPTVSSNTYVPEPVPILSVDTSSSQGPNGVRRYKALVNWNDAPGKDFYVMKLSFKEIDSDTVYGGQYLYSDDISMNEVSAAEPGGELNEVYYNELYFTDEFFDGQSKTLDIRFPKNEFDVSFDEIRFQFHLYRCNEETYKYLISVKKASYLDFFSEPVKVYSNITNGYGIFGGMGESVYLK